MIGLAEGCQIKPEVLLVVLLVRLATATARSQKIHINSFGSFWI